MLRSLVVFALAAAAGACAPKLTVRTLEPGPVNLGGATGLLIVDGQGRRSAIETVYQELESQARAAGYYHVVDKTSSGARVNLAGRSVRVAGFNPRALRGDQLGMKVDVVEWNANERTRQKTFTDKKGKRYTSPVQVLEGSVVLAVTIFDSKRHAILAESEYEGTADSEDLKRTSDDAIRRSAAAAAVTSLLADITPHTVARQVRLDDSDEAQKPIIETATKGSVAQARKDTARYLRKHPNNAAAHYNLAVFMDAMGDYSRALHEYDRAIRLGGKDFYSSARAGCARRMAAAKALNK